MKAIAWSEQGEQRARAWWALAMLGIIFGILVTVAGAVLVDWRYITAGVGIALALAMVQGKQRMRIAAMQANKPEHGAVGLTRWHWHACGEIFIVCLCGRADTFEGKQFFPRAEDPGGGRYSFVCGCGRGHYKFPVAVQ